MYSVPNDAVENGFLKEVIEERDSLGILISDNGQSQIGLEILSSLIKNHPLHKECVIFSNDITDFPSTVPCGVFHTSYMYEFSGSIITDKLSYLHEIDKYPKIKNIVWYVRDMQEVSSFSDEYINNVAENKNILKIFPSEFYLKYIMQTKGVRNLVNSSDVFVPFWDLEQITSIIDRGTND